MKVSKNLAKWAYAWNYALDRTPYYHETGKWDERRQPYPENISLCPLFWRTFAVTPALIMGGLFIATAALVGVREFIGPLAIAAGALTGAFGIAWLVSKLIPVGFGAAISDRFDTAISYVSPVFKGAVKVKKTMCPIFEVKK